MTTRSGALSIVVSSIVFGAVVVIEGGLVPATTDASWQTVDIRSAQEKAFREGGFRAAAAITGSYVRELRLTEDQGPTTIDELVAGSEVVLVGRIRANQGVLVPAGEWIRTHYQVQVLELLKGQNILTSRQHTVLSVLGGRAGFPDGTWAQLNVRFVDLPAPGERLLVFANRVPPSAFSGVRQWEVPGAELWPTHGPAGLYSLGPTGTDLRPLQRFRRAFTPAREFGRDAAAFLIQVRESIRRTGK